MPGAAPSPVTEPADAADVATSWLSCHVGYACRHSGACCRSGWPLPVEASVVSVIDAAVARGRLPTVDGDVHWLDASPAAAGETAGTFRQTGGGCVFHVSSAPQDAPSHGPRENASDAPLVERARHCAVHAVLGHEALPASCQHFPRVCLVDDRGVRVSLSHYCPTAAAMLVDHDAPLAIVPGPPPVPGRAVPEGLDVRGELPPRLTDRVLTDLAGLTAWEARVVGALAGPGAADSPERAVARVVAEARHLARWSPAAGPSLAEAVAALDTVAHADDLDATSARLADAATWPAWFDVAASACHGAWLADDPPSDLADLDARFVAPAWARHAAAARRYLAAKAFGSWIAYQADAAESLAAWLTLCLAVLRVEAARACGAAGRPLDRHLLVRAIRQADLLLVHYADSLAMAQRLRGHPARG